VLRLGRSDRPGGAVLKVPGCKWTMPRGEGATGTVPEDQVVGVMASARARTFSIDRAGAGWLTTSAGAVFAPR